MSEPRCMSRHEAAGYCGLSPEGFANWQRRGIVPGPIPGTRKWDREALKASLDRMSGLGTHSQPVSEYQQWKAQQNARQA